MSSRLTALLLLAAAAAPTLAAVDFNRDAYAWRESALCYAVTGEAYWWTRGRTLREHLEELDRETAGKGDPGRGSGGARRARWAQHPGLQRSKGSVRRQPGRAWG